MDGHQVDKNSPLLPCIDPNIITVFTNFLLSSHETLKPRDRHLSRRHSFKALLQEFLHRFFFPIFRTNEGLISSILVLLFVCGVIYVVCSTSSATSALIHIENTLSHP